MAEPAFRAFWADAFRAGFKSTSQIDTMVARALEGNYNAIIAEVLAYQDNVGNGHGAYWNSAIVPKAGDIQGGIDPLAYLCQQAHAAGIEVHAWLVAYRVSTSWPPSGNTTLANNPQWFMVPLDDMDGGPARIDGKYTLDPGSPDVQEYLVSIVRELVTNYPIDGINWDYIRYIQSDAGYPADASYENSSLARFQRITGYSGTPPDNESSWNDFRRRTINELVRRCWAEIPSIPNPRHPLRHTADLICWGNAPANFTSSGAYVRFQNWRHWMEMGWLDAGIPMNYKREHVTSPNNHAQWYRNWVDAAIGWRYGRHMYCGQGNYLNTMANSITQLQYVYAAGADGSSNYSYHATADQDLDGNWEHDPSWYPYVAANFFTTPVPTPAMPWRDPATATQGTLWGRVTDQSGLPLDDALVQITGGGAAPFPSSRTDGNGYYVLTRIPATAAGTPYDVTAGISGLQEVIHQGVEVVAGDVRRRDFALGPCIDRLITDFEGFPVGTEVMFRQPSFSGSTNQHLASQPNFRGVTDEVPAFSGDQCYKLSWQFLDDGLHRWMRATTSNAANVRNPTIMLDRPVRVRLRLDEGSLRVSLGIRETGTTALVGEDGGTSGAIEWVGPSAQIGSAPQGKFLAAAPGVWQTLVFDPLRDPIRPQTGDGILSSPTNKGTLEQLAFASTGGAGPFTVYIDAVEQLCSAPPWSVTDIDRDGDVDQEDFGRFQACLSGFSVPLAPGCEPADFNGDGYVDQTDLNLIQACMGGPNRPIAAGCAD